MLLLTTLLARPLSAQGQEGALRGTVVDEEGKPLPSALVQVDGANLRWSQRSGSNGQFLFPRLGVGHWTLSATAVGFATERLSVAVTESTVVLSVPLRALSVSMPAIPSAGKRTGVVGMLVSRNELAPVRGASITFVESGATAMTEGHGLFFVGDLDPVPAVVLVRHAGYLATFQSVTVVRDTLARMLVVLDSVSVDPDSTVQEFMAEFEDRIAQRGSRSMLVPHSPAFDGFRGVPVRWAIDRLFADPRRVARQTFPIDPMSSCILAFNLPPSVTPVALDEIDAADIEAMEVYDQRSDAGHRMRMRMSQEDASTCLKDGGGYATTSGAVPRLNPFNPFAYSPQQGISRGTLIIIWMKSPDRWRH